MIRHPCAVAAAAAVAVRARAALRAALRGGERSAAAGVAARRRAALARVELLGTAGVAARAAGAASAAAARAAGVDEPWARALGARRAAVADGERAARRVPECGLQECARRVAASVAGYGRPRTGRSGQPSPHGRRRRTSGGGAPPSAQSRAGLRAGEEAVRDARLLDQPPPPPATPTVSQSGMPRCRRLWSERAQRDALLGAAGLQVDELSTRAGCDGAAGSGQLELLEPQARGAAGVSRAEAAGRTVARLEKKAREGEEEARGHINALAACDRMERAYFAVFWRLFTREEPAGRDAVKQEEDRGLGVLMAPQLLGGEETEQRQVLGGMIRSVVGQLAACMHLIFPERRARGRLARDEEVCFQPGLRAARIIDLRAEGIHDLIRHVAGKGAAAFAVKGSSGSGERERRRVLLRDEQRERGDIRSAQLRAERQLDREDADKSREYNSYCKSRLRLRPDLCTLPFLERRTRNADELPLELDIRRPSGGAARAGAAGGAAPVAVASRPLGAGAHYYAMDGRRHCRPPRGAAGRALLRTPPSASSDDAPPEPLPPPPAVGSPHHQHSNDDGAGARGAARAAAAELRRP
eukprot:gene15615-61450_t